MKTLSSRLVAVLVTLTMVNVPLPASADPGDVTVEEVSTPLGGVILMTKQTTLSVPKPSLETTNASKTTDLGGGVTAWSSAGLQWRNGVWFHDVQGLTRSQTSSTIQEIETHGALVKGYPGECFFGDNVWVVDPIIRYNDSIADSGWGPWHWGRNGEQCWGMATSHYYVHNAKKTILNEPNISKQL